MSVGLGICAPAIILQRGAASRPVQPRTLADQAQTTLAAGVDAIGSTADELAAYVKNDTLRMGKVIRDANIRE